MPRLCVEFTPLLRRAADALENAGSGHRLRSIEVRWRAFLLYIWMAFLYASLGLERRLRALDEVLTLIPAHIRTVASSASLSW